MNLIIISAISILFAVLFLVLWLRERRHANEAEIVAYGLRAEDGNDENTKTNISQLELEYGAAIDKLQQMGDGDTGFGPRPEKNWTVLINPGWSLQFRDFNCFPTIFYWLLYSIV